MWSDTNKHKLNIILKEIQINTQGDAPPCTSALLRWQWPTPQCGHVWCTRSPHTLLQNGRAAFDVSVNSPKLNIQLSCNLVVPFLLYPRGLKTSVPMNLYYTFTIHISQSLNFKVKKKKKTQQLSLAWSVVEPDQNEEMATTSPARRCHRMSGDKGAWGHQNFYLI